MPSLAGTFVSISIQRLKWNFNVKCPCGCRLSGLVLDFSAFKKETPFVVGSVSILRRKHGRRIMQLISSERAQHWVRISLCKWHVSASSWLFLSEKDSSIYELLFSLLTLKRPLKLTNPCCRTLSSVEMNAIPWFFTNNMIIRDSNTHS